MNTDKETCLHQPQIYTHTHTKGVGEGKYILYDTDFSTGEVKTDKSPKPFGLAYMVNPRQLIDTVSKNKVDSS